MVKAPVYPLAPATINTFFREVRFADNPPSIVIVAVMERNITTRLPRLETQLLEVPEYKKVLFRMEMALQTNSFIQSFMVPLDRALKSNLIYSSRASLRRILEPQSGTALPCEKMFFFQGEKANEEVPAEDFQRAVATIRSYHDGLRKKGIRFIFFPIPNKETIYYELLPAGKRPVFIPKLVSALEALGIEVIDSQLIFEEARRRKGTLLYHRDDTHWNGEGVRVFAEALASLIGDRAR